MLIGGPEAVAGLAEYRSMISDGVAPETMSVYKEDESAGAFLRGDAVFMRNWPYVYDLISDPAQSKVRPEQVGVAERPSSDGEPGNGTVGDQPYYISATSANADAAWEFIRFMTAPEQQVFRATEGSHPSGDRRGLGSSAASIRRFRRIRHLSRATGEGLRFGGGLLDCGLLDEQDVGLRERRS